MAGLVIALRRAARRPRRPLTEYMELSTVCDACETGKNVRTAAGRWRGKIREFHEEIALLVASCRPAAAAPALAQDTGARATYQEIELDSGFRATQVIRLDAGGNINADRLGSPCTGFIARAPDVRLTYNAGALR